MAPKANAEAVPFVPVVEEMVQSRGPRPGVHFDCRSTLARLRTEQRRERKGATVDFEMSMRSFVRQALLTGKASVKPKLCACCLHYGVVLKLCRGLQRQWIQNFGAPN